jgi:predicted unusual protein kinase regulating ubiquinone biosynthesis (AarF/ABC1/UbiB family)
VTTDEENFVTRHGAPCGSDGKARVGDGIPQGRVRRAAPVAGAAVRTAGDAVVVALRRKVNGVDDPALAVRTAERYAELLGRSKGALMKAGQMLSFVSMGPAVAPEFRSAFQTALGRLRADAPPMAPALARAVLEQELGQRAEDVFAEFAWEPLAAASIGQVHAARLPDGRRVAVKVQYPGVAAAIRADLKNTELIATFLSLLGGLSPTRVRIDMRGVAEEIEARISEELDYRREAANQREFAALYHGHPFIHVPAVITELSGDRVLTQELVEGRPWREALSATQELRDQWGEAIFRFLFGAQNRFCLFHADPHPGNYLFHDDGSVSFLDYGCVKRLRREQVSMMYAILRACVRGDVLGTWQASVEAGFFRSTDRITPEEVYDYWRHSCEMYWGEQPFTVTPETADGVIESKYSPTGSSANASRHVSAPGENATLARLEVGVTSVLAELHATNYWDTMAAELFEDAPPVTTMGKLDQAFFEQQRQVAGGA